MAEKWSEVDRICAYSGTCARDAVFWWVQEKFGVRRKWQWVEILVGTFRVDDEAPLYAIRLGGVETDSWVFMSLN